MLKEINNDLVILMYELETLAGRIDTGEDLSNQKYNYVYEVQEILAKLRRAIYEYES